MPEYYKLEKAAEIMNCQTDDLIQMGASGKLAIQVLLGAWQVRCIRIIAQCPEEGDGHLSCSEPYKKVRWQCLAEYFAGKMDAPILLEDDVIYTGYYRDKLAQDCYRWEFNGERWQYPIGFWRYSLRRKDYLYPSYKMLRDYQRQGGNIDDIYPEPVKLSECQLVVLADDLKGKKPKRLKPIERVTTESLSLIYEITKSHEVKYLHQLPAEQAWGLIVSKKFQTDLIAEYPTMKPRADLVLNDGTALDKRAFTQKYLKRFE